MLMQRVWAMPTADTFDCGPIGDFVQRYLRQAKVSVDPFARNKRWATYTNDLNPDTAAEYHMDAEAFLAMLAEKGVVADLIIIDPPYSPGQMSEVYSSVGLSKDGNGGQNGALYRRVKIAADRIVALGGYVLLFGWNSAGMGDGRGYDSEELMLVCHGGAHNDTICIAERKTSRQLSLIDAFLV